jgi:hypothetical protein
MKAIEPWEEDQAFDREDALDHERTRRYQQSALPLFREFSCSQSSSRIRERLEGEGWGHELRTYPRCYDGLKDQPGVKISKALTDKGTFVHPWGSHSL